MFKKTIMPIIFLLNLTFPLYATNDLNAEEVWISENNTPPVVVSIQGNLVQAKTWSYKPSTELQTINSELLRQHKLDYIQIKDFDLDGTTDIGVLSGTGYGGNDKCYSVYEYNTSTLTYDLKMAFTACP